MRTSTISFLEQVIPQPPKVLVIKSNDALIKLGKFGAWCRVTTLKQYDDGTFDICWGQEWSYYGKEATLQVQY